MAAGPAHRNPGRQAGAAAVRGLRPGTCAAHADADPGAGAPNLAGTALLQGRRDGRSPGSGPVGTLADGRRVRRLAGPAHGRRASAGPGQNLRRRRAVECLGRPPPARRVRRRTPRARVVAGSATARSVRSDRPGAWRARRRPAGLAASCPRAALGWSGHTVELGGPADQPRIYVDRHRPDPVVEWPVRVRRGQSAASLHRGSAGGRAARTGPSAARGHGRAGAVGCQRRWRRSGHRRGRCAQPGQRLSGSFPEGPF